MATKLTDEQQAYYQRLAQAEMEAAERQREQTQQQIAQSRQMQQAPQPRNGETVPQPRQAGQYTNMAGISDNSRASLNYYGQGYQPSETVLQAQQYLSDVLDKQPGQYQNSYAGQIEKLYNQLMNRPKFTYDVNRDPLFQSYKNQYMVNGQRAMQDTIGNAAALTGGYGNSWGTTAGYQAYQQYLQALNSVVPELEQRAYDRWGAEGDQLRDNLATALSMEGRDYDRYRDALGDWQADRSFARGVYDTEAERGRSDWNTMLNYYLNQAQLEQNDYWRQLELLNAGGSGGSGGGGSWPTAEDEQKYLLPLNWREEELKSGIGDMLSSPYANRAFTEEEMRKLLETGQKVRSDSFQSKAQEAQTAQQKERQNAIDAVNKARDSGWFGDYATYQNALQKASGVNLNALRALNNPTQNLKNAVGQAKNGTNRQQVSQVESLWGKELANEYEEALKNMKK